MFGQPITTLIAQTIFIIALAMIAFTYVGYPIVMRIISSVFRRPVRRAAILPRVSIIIAARNEEANIGAKLENALSLDYPEDKLEIVVASDASTDRTDEIVQGFGRQGVVLYRQMERQGKTRAQYRAVSASSGEILVMSDATTMYQPDVIHKLVRNFADPNVGCVAGQLIYVDGKSSAVGKGCRSYWSYEKVIKSWESQTGSLIGVSGCLYAVRRSCQSKLPSDMIDDFVIATEIHLQGLRTVYEPEAISIEDTNHKTKDEMRMRIRVIEQTMRALQRYSHVLNPFEHGLFAFQLHCHKILRYLIPAMLAVAFVANWFAWNGDGLFKYTFLAQAAAYATALMGWLGDRFKIKMGPLAIPYYFLLVNFASVMAFKKFMRGESFVTWEPVREVKKSQTPPPDSLTEASS
jgi:cellulose synthase/poly-beta-1,6-N-acetylglucosamine synthase-like glycosyltransferase